MGFIYLTDQQLESQHQQEYLDKENNLSLVLTSGQTEKSSENNDSWEGLMYL